MRYFEIILKIVFLGAVLVVGFNNDLLFSRWLCVILTVSLLLGIVLLLNKKQSYGYELSMREVKIRRIEGVLLVVFGMIFGILRIKGII
jgi:hypothetical protein